MIKKIKLNTVLFISGQIRESATLERHFNTFTITIDDNPMSLRSASLPNSDIPRMSLVAELNLKLERDATGIEKQERRECNQKCID